MAQSPSRPQGLPVCGAGRSSAGESAVFSVILSSKQAANASVIAFALVLGFRQPVSRRNAEEC